MPASQYRQRRAWRLENDRLRVTVTVEGGHIAEIVHLPTEINPLWSPHWPTIDPSTYRRETHPEYGDSVEASLLSGIAGHNLCLDLFGPPSADEAVAGVPTHGESSVVPYVLADEDGGMVCRAQMPMAQLAFQRHLRLDGDTIAIEETVENLSPLDRPIAWTQHVTLGAPFLEKGKTEFDAPTVRAQTIEGAAVADPKDALRVYPDVASHGGYTAHLMDRDRVDAYFHAYSPTHGLLFGYQWQSVDFPWLGVWDENHNRMAAPWEGKELTRGMEFGASPIPEPRRAMIDRGQLFGVPGYRWLPALSKITVRYTAFLRTASGLPA